MSVSDRMTSTALARAKAHVDDVCSQGYDVVLVGATARDEMGGITGESNVTLKSFPIRYSPFDREVIQKITWAEDTEVLCYISKQAIDDLDLSLNRLKKKYRKMRIDKKTYDIRYIDYYSAFGTDFLYVVIGGKK